MSNYTKTTNFTAKDALASGNPSKLVKGTEIDAEFDAIETASATKADSASPTFTGTVTATSTTVALNAATITGDVTCSGDWEFDGLVKQAKGGDVASAAALTLTTDGNFFDITGTTAITSIGTLAVGTRVILQFDGALTLTHHATDLILPSGANITTAAGDVAEFVEYATGDWVCINYSRASGESTSILDGAVSTAKLAAGAVQQAKITTSTVSLAGSIGISSSVEISMNAYAFFPMIHQTYDGGNPGTNAREGMRGLTTDGADPDAPGFSLWNDDLTTGTTYDVDYRYISS